MNLELFIKVIIWSKTDFSQPKCIKVGQKKVKDLWTLKIVNIK